MIFYIHKVAWFFLMSIHISYKDINVHATTSGHQILLDWHYSEVNCKYDVDNIFAWFSTQVNRCEICGNFRLRFLMSIDSTGQLTRLALSVKRLV